MILSTTSKICQAIEKYYQSKIYISINKIYIDLYVVYNLGIFGYENVIWILKSKKDRTVFLLILFCKYVL